MTAVRFYLDDNSGDLRWVAGLERAGIEVLRSIEAGREGAPDEVHLEFATQERWCLVTADITDFAELSAARLRSGESHCGIVMVRDGRHSPGDVVRRLRHIAQEMTLEDLEGRVEFLSGWSPID